MWTTELNDNSESEKENKDSIYPACVLLQKLRCKTGQQYRYSGPVSQPLRGMLKETAWGLRWAKLLGDTWLEYFGHHHFPPNFILLLFLIFILKFSVLMYGILVTTSSGHPPMFYASPYSPEEPSSVGFLVFLVSAGHHR